MMNMLINKKRFSFKTQIPLQVHDLAIPQRQHKSIFKTFLNESLQNNEQQIHKMMNNQFNQSYEELLIEELKKPSSKENDVIQLFRRRNQVNPLCPQELRSIELTVYLLQHLKKFHQFIHFNRIDPWDLRKVASYLKYQYYPKGSYIYSSHEYSKKFYCIIKGTVSMRKRIVIPYHLNANISIEARKRNDSISEYNFVSSDSSITDIQPLLSPNELRSQFEVEQCRFTDGMPFGEWNLIDNTIHSTSAYCNEDTHVFYLTKDHFDTYLGNSISQAVIESKQFVHDCIPLLSKEDLNQLKPEFHDKGDIIYTQYTKARECFVVYQGECILTYDPKARNMEDIMEKKNRMKIRTIVDKGGIAGLDSENTNENYEDNLIVSQDCTILYRLDTQEFEKKMNLKAYLRNFKKEKMKLLTPNNHHSRYKRLIPNQIKKRGRSNNDGDNDDSIPKKKMKKLINIMVNHHKKKDQNKLNPTIMNINYSNFKAFGSRAKKVKTRNVNSYCSPLNHHNNNKSSNNDKETSGNNNRSTQRQTQPSDNKASPLNNSFSKEPSNRFQNDLVSKPSLSNVTVLLPSATSTAKLKEKRDMKLIRVDSNIKNTLRQISKNSIKQIVYNSGRYNIPLLNSQLNVSSSLI